MLQRRANALRVGDVHLASFSPDMVFHRNGIIPSVVGIRNSEVDGWESCTIHIQGVLIPILDMVKCCPPPENRRDNCGGMAERLQAHVLKTCLGHTNVGSNPTPSAEGCMIECPNV